jgi:hypothetical protein
LRVLVEDQLTQLADLGRNVFIAAVRGGHRAKQGACGRSSPRAVEKRSQ